MSELLPVELVFCGEPFDAGAVRHTLRHLAMRVGWRLVAHSRYRLLYVTRGTALPDDDKLGSTECVVVPSSREVAEHLRHGRTPFAVVDRGNGRVMPFPQEAPRSQPGWLDGDVIAGAYACLNLWFEQRTHPAPHDGWITFGKDWMARAGLRDPLPLADRWLDMIYETAVELGWPATKPSRRFTIVLTHDVDYLPGRSNRGLPRFLRAFCRQLIVRRRPRDAARLLLHYGAVATRSGRPYLEVPRIVAEEKQKEARSSFQFVVASTHRRDPRYTERDIPWDAVPPDWEVCLHGSYRAARTAGRVAAERARLERMANRPVCGYRQHYLNFEPAGLFREVAAAGLRYDMSVGYNDRSGPRAGTYFPFKPYDLDGAQPYAFWEIPLVLMDTTLATTHRLGAAEALQHARMTLEPVIAAGGCVALIWHQEQCGGLLDPGYDEVYSQLLSGLARHGGRLTTGAGVISELDAAWQESADGP